MSRSHLALVLLACTPLAAQSLRDLADQRSLRFGAAVNPSRFSESDYATTLGREFNQVTAEYVMKFEPTHPGPTTYSFTQADSIVTFARARNMAVRGHAFVWHISNPRWLTTGNYTPEQLSDILQDHIKTVGGHFAGRVYAWDVVNEAFNDNGSLRSTIWYDGPGIGLKGTEYIEQAFRWAHEADPKALLFYNDYSAEGLNAKSNAIYEMARDFVTRGVPIHGIGLQAHFTANIGSIANIESNIRRITELGLQAHITELDVRVAVDSSGRATDAVLATQAQIYNNIVTSCLKFPLCTSIQTWGFTDKYSWIPGSFPGLGAALEFDANYAPKPAYNAMLNALRDSPPVIPANGLVNAANYTGDAVSPGEIVTLFGANYGQPTLVIAGADANLRLPTNFAETRLLFDGVAAPILYTQAGLTSAAVPYSVSGATTAQVQYEFRGKRSNAITVKVVPAHPGVFTLDSRGQGAGAILDLSHRVVNEQNAAAKGAYIQIFATGGGMTRPSSADGLIASAAPIPELIAPVSVTIGGIDCAVQYAGGASGLVAGGVQINALVDSRVPSGLQPLVVTVGGAASQPGVTVWVK